MQIGQLLKVLELLKNESDKAQSGEIYNTMFTIFLLVAEYDKNDGLTMKDLAQRLNISSATVTRAVQGLSIRGIPPRKGQEQGKPGLGLVDVTTPIDDWRSKRVILSEHGRELIKTIEKL